MSNDNQGHGPVEGVARFAKDEILGGRQWRRSKVASLTGMSSIVDSVDSTKAAGRESVGRVSTLFGMAFRQERGGHAIPETITDSRDRFLASMQRNGKSTRDIARSVGNTYAQFWLYAGLMACTLVLAFLTFPPRASINGVGDVAVSILFRMIPLPLLAALTLRAGWTNWCFRRFRLEGLPGYFAAGNGMLPKKALEGRASLPAAPPAGRGASVAKRIGFIAAVGLGALIAMHIHTTPALADTLSDGQAAANKVFVDPNSSDMFIKLMSYVIPNAGPIPTNAMAGDAGPYKLIRDGLSLFAATLLFIGMLMSGWQIITGIVASAKEGTAIGRNYHEVWAPVRTVIGYGMLVPVANGLCGAQILCLYLIAWGGNLANIIWLPYVSGATYTTTSNNSQTLVQQAMQTQGKTIANGIIQQIFEKELCRASIQTSFIRTGYVMFGAAAPQSSPDFVAAWGNSLNPWQKDNAYTADYGSICGKIELTVRAPVSGQRYDNQWQSYDTGQEDNRAVAIGEKRKQAVIDMKKAIVPFAEQAAQTYQNNSGSSAAYFSAGGEGYKSLPAQINTIRDRYINQLTEGVTSVAGSNLSGNSTELMDNLKKQAATDGWAASGMYYLTLARIQGNLYSGAFGGVKSEPITQQSAAAMSSELAKYLFGTDNNAGIIPAFRAFWAQNTNQITMDSSSNIMKAGSNSVYDLISEWTLWTGGLFMHIDVNPLNPMQGMIDYGDFLMRTGIGIYFGFQAINSDSFAIGTAALASAGAGVGGGLALAAAKSVSGWAFNAIMAPIQLVAAGLVIAGAVHSYVIPMIPYIMVLFFISSMLLLTVESLVAAPLWAFFHIRLDGSEFIDQVQKPGYMIAFNLLLRPVLMIFGLILSMLTFGAMSWFVTQTYMPAANGLSASTTVGPIGALVLVVILAYINLQIATKSFHLIVEIPDRVTRWFGQNGERLEEQHDTTRLTGAVMTQAVNRGESMVSGAMTGALGKGMGRARNNQDRGDGAAENAVANVRGGPPAGARNADRNGGDSGGAKEAASAAAKLAGASKAPGMMKN